MIGIDDIVSLGLSLTGKVIDRLWPDPAQAAAAKLELLKMQQTGELAQLAADTDLAKGQLATNTAEAANANIFVAGWRPFVGWVCGCGLAYDFICAPLLTFGAHLAGSQTTAPPLDLSTMLPLLFGMLGLGGMRTMEKLAGKAGAVS